MFFLIPGGGQMKHKPFKTSFSSEEQVVLMSSLTFIGHPLINLRIKFAIIMYYWKAIEVFFGVERNY